MNIAQIIKGCQNNQRKSQKLLVEQFSQLLYTISLRYAPDRESAKDILQEAWIRVFKYIQKFDSKKGNLEAWMRKIVINTALQRYKHLRYETEKSGLEHVQSHTFIPSVYAQLGAKELMQLVDKLPEGFRLVFNLYVVEGYSHKEIAAMLNIQEASSRSQLQRARKQLQALIAKQENYNNYESKAV